MSKLALVGGKAVFDRPLELRSVWPPVDDVTATKLQELYRSRRWTAFDEHDSAFSSAFANHHGAKHGIFMVNGTVTLQCALAAYGVGPGDEVIIPPLTWCATALAVRHVGAVPVFVDILPDTLCIDPEKIEAAITPHTKAIILVHAYGSMADMNLILPLAQRHGLKVIEDCAHMHGGIWDGQRVGSMGDVGSFSFQQTKTMASGEGGICITSDTAIAERIHRMKQIGYGPGEIPRQAKSGPPTDLLCYNFRATAFQALILHEQLNTLDARLKRYEAAVHYLEDRLKLSTRIRFQQRGRKATLQGYFAWLMLFDDPVYDGISVQIIQRALAAEGLPVHLGEGPIYKFILFNVGPQDYRIDQSCEVTEHTCRNVLWMLHAYLGLERDQLEKLAETIEKVMSDPDTLRAHSKDMAQDVIR